MTHFPVAAIDAPFWLPVAAGAVVSFFSSMVGVSGAVLLLPFQMSVLGFTSPAVSPTNLVFNIVAIPSGVYRYFREGRLLCPLAWLLALGTVPGMLAGVLIRFQWLPAPGPFKIFAGLVLLGIALRLIWTARAPVTAPEAPAADGTAHVTELSLARFRLQYAGREHGCSMPALLALSLGVGLVGGIYGIGGGAIIAPLLVGVFGLPLQAIAGATLTCTFVTSIAGAGFSQAVAPLYRAGGMSVAPDWLLGALFGLGGAIGMYAGARTQKHVPSGWLRALLAVLLMAVSLSYLSALLRP